METIEIFQENLKELMQDKNLESIKFVSSNLQNKMTSVKINKSFAAHFSEFLR